uniref:Uncharacterized protein n=1 Tax=Anguilla anguilla TaxID=7936 RepID=A0A0E9WTE3_ANGAN
MGFSPRLAPGNNLITQGVCHLQPLNTRCVPAPVTRKKDAERFFNERIYNLTLQHVVKTNVKV